MKILHVITSLSDGGAEAVLYRLCKHDTYNKHHVISLIGSGKYSTLLEEIGIPVQSIGFGKLLLVPYCFLKLIISISRVKPDVVQTWMYHSDLLGGLAAKLAKVKRLVWGIHNTNLEAGKSKRSTIIIVKCLSMISWFIPSKIAVCSLKAINIHKELNYDENKMVFIPNGYDTDCFKPDKVNRNRIRSELNISNSDFLIGMVGRFDPQKDHNNLILALSYLSSLNVEFKCILIGANVDISNSELVNLLTINNLLDRVFLLGRRDDIPSIMNAIDLHVLSSAFGEAFPNVVCEAMSTATPCVVTDIGDCSYIVGETGWVVPHQNPIMLADAINKAILQNGNADAWQQRQLDCRTRIQNNFNIQLMVDGYNNMWLSLDR